ncbi:MAG: hypothetical protein HGA22_01040 [Clostridiales bacterium]|nr:hypothetical protein [Clostridiales bacterium]
MDWARAKNIILLLLISLNLFLGYRMVVFGMQKNIPAETIRNCEEILKSRGVTLECDIPRYNKDTARLVYGNFIFDKEMMIKRFMGNGYGIAQPGTAVDMDGGSAAGKTIFINDDRKMYFPSDSSFIMIDGSPEGIISDFGFKSAEAWLRKNFTDEGLVGRDYVLDEEIKNSDGSIRLIFHEKFKGMLVFGNYVDATVTEKGVTRLEVGYRQIRRFSAEKVGGLVAAYQVLLKNFDGSGAPVITAITFGYMDVTDQETAGLQSTEQPPVWRIKVEGEDTSRYFNATTGLEIKKE